MRRNFKVSGHTAFTEDFDGVTSSYPGIEKANLLLDESVP
jgi:hypothetical protein